MKQQFKQIPTVAVRALFFFVGRPFPPFFRSIERVIPLYVNPTDGSFIGFICANGGCCEILYYGAALRPLFWLLLFGFAGKKVGDRLRRLQSLFSFMEKKKCDPVITICSKRPHSFCVPPGIELTQPPCKRMVTTACSKSVV